MTKRKHPHYTYMSCYGKDIYETWGHAERACKKAKRRSHALLEPYRCHACQKFHLGAVQRKGRMMR